MKSRAKKLIVHLWSTLLGAFVLAALLAAPVLGTVGILVLICWLIGRPLMAKIQGGFGLDM
jgi:hypothetical protein